MFKAGRLIRESLYPSNKNHDLLEVGLIFRILGYLTKGHIV